MNYYYVILSALIVTFILTLIISQFSRRPMRGLWTYFFIVFLATWAGQLWINPFGPTYWGISWISLIIAPIFFWVLILALIPPLPSTKEEEAASAILGVFFWIVLIALLLSIGTGYYRIIRTGSGPERGISA
jgi:hypothetical protein